MHWPMQRPALVSRRLHVDEIDTVDAIMQPRPHLPGDKVRSCRLASKKRRNEQLDRLRKRAAAASSTREISGNFVACDGHGAAERVAVG